MNSQYQHAYCQVSGTPFEQGVQQGQELSDAIRRNLASVHRKLEQEKVDLQAYQAFVNQNLRFFQEQRPEIEVYKRQALHWCRLWHGGRTAAGPVPVLRRGAWDDGGILRRYQLPHHLHPPGL